MKNTTPKQKQPKIAVLKFSGSLLAKVEEIPQAVHEIYQYLRQGYRVLAIVSAMDENNHNLTLSGTEGFESDGCIPPAQEFAELLASGETAIACQFTIGLDRAGIKAKKLHHQCLLTKNSFLNSDPDSFTTDLVISLFERYSVLVLPGAIGYDQAKATTLLGRKGADYTAIYTAWSLRAAECVIYKDVGGFYEKESKEGEARQYECLNYDDLLKLPSTIIHHKAIKFAKAHQITFSVKSLTGMHKTSIGTKPSQFLLHKHPSPKLNVVLFGLGTVGFGVYKHLLDNQHVFNVVGVAVTNLNKHQGEQLPNDLISTDWKEVLARNCDVVIELTGNTTCAEAIIRQSLTQGRHVITANRALIAEKGCELCQLASHHNVHLLYSATLGGAIPIVETLQNISDSEQVESITGVLNSTCNFILDKVKEGQTLSNTLSLAKIVGMAENESTLDLYGHDATQKAIILSRIAFGRDPDTIDCTGIQHVDEATIREADIAQKNIRLVINCALENHVIHAKIEPIAIDIDQPLAHVTGIHNAILIRTQDNKIIELHGKGTGRWPVAESVFADLISLANQLKHQQQHVNLTVRKTSTQSKKSSELLQEKEVV